MRRSGLVGLVLLLSVSLSGCLGDDMWKEPFRWEEAVTFGQEPDAAAAFTEILAGLGDTGGSTLSSTISTAQDLPDGAVFQNAKEFLDRQAPGTGTTAEQTVRLALEEGGDVVVRFTGTAAEAYERFTGAAIDANAPMTFEVPERTTRVRWVFDAVLSSENPPGASMTVRVIDPRGAVRAEYSAEGARKVTDMVIEGTVGDRGEVEAHLGGVWHVEVDAVAQGAWRIAFETYSPKYDDYEWWQFWRADRREVAT